MTHRTHTVETLALDVDGVSVAARLFVPESPRALVLLAGAMAVPQGFYARFAGALASRGIAVVTVDYRGIGASRPAALRGFDARATDWVRDLDASVAAARERLPGLPLSAIGHSFGGQVLPLLAEAEELQRVVTVGAQFAHPSRWQGWERRRYAFLFHAWIPALTATFGYAPGWAGLGEDAPAGVVRDWALWCTTERYLLDHVRGANLRYASFDARVHALAVDDDDYAPLAGVKAFASHLPDATVELVRARDHGLDRLGHFAPFRPEGQAVWSRMFDLVDPIAEASRDARVA